MGMKLRLHSRWIRFELELGRARDPRPLIRRVRAPDLILRRRLWLMFWAALRGAPARGETPT
jgi:hypothetical protein